VSNDEERTKLGEVRQEQIKLAADVANVEAGMLKMSDTVGELANNLSALIDGIVDMKNVLLSLTHIAKEHQEQIGEMINYGSIINERLKETDSRLSVIINALDPWVNGSKPN
jgi:hypothetical protein